MPWHERIRRHRLDSPAPIGTSPKRSTYPRMEHSMNLIPASTRLPALIALGLAGCVSRADVDEIKQQQKDSMAKLDQVPGAAAELRRRDLIHPRSTRSRSAIRQRR